MKMWPIICCLMVCCCCCCSKVDAAKRDVNDIELECPQSVMMTEGSGPDVYVTQVGAFWNGQRMKFSTDPANIYLTIDPVSGIVETTGVSVDREVLTAINLTVLVSPASSADGPVATCSMTVSVEDVNDNGPVFFRQRYGDISVAPAMKVDTIVETVLAEDRDTGLNGAVFYSLQNGDPEAEVKFTDYFQVDRTSGQLKLVKPIDLSSTPALFQFDGIVVASDGGSPPKRSTAPVTPQVLKPPTYRQIDTSEGYLVTVEAFSYTGEKNDLIFTLLTPDDYTMRVQCNSRVIDISCSKETDSTYPEMRLAIRDGFGAQVIVSGFESRRLLNGTQALYLAPSPAAYFYAGNYDNSVTVTSLSTQLVLLCVTLTFMTIFYVR